MITRYNVFTVNKWILKTQKSILYKKYLTFSYALLSFFWPFYDVIA